MCPHNIKLFYILQIHTNDHIMTLVFLASTKVSEIYQWGPISFTGTVPCIRFYEYIALHFSSWCMDISIFSNFLSEQVGMWWTSSLGFFLHIVQVSLAWMSRCGVADWQDCIILTIPDTIPYCPSKVVVLIYPNDSSCKHFHFSRFSPGFAYLPI